MRRPTIGSRILRGMDIISARTLRQIDSGFIPPDWTGKKLADVKAACKYTLRMAAWDRNRHTPAAADDQEAINE